MQNRKSSIKTVVFDNLVFLGPKISIIKPFVGWRERVQKGSAQHSDVEVRRSICDVWRPTFDVRPPTLNAHCAPSGAQRLMSNTGRPQLDVQRRRAAFNLHVADAKHGLQ